MADLFKALKPTAHVAKNGFDLSRKHVFSANAGQALPCLCLETVPGDHMEIELDALTRTQTFNTAAFVRGKQRFDFFFVPYSQLWHPFNQFITQRTDKHSTNQKGHIYCPIISLGTLLDMIYAEWDNNTADMFQMAHFKNMIKLLDLLGYGNFDWIGSSDFDDTLWNDYCEPYREKFVNIFRLAAYQHIWYDYYRNKYYDVPESGGITSYDIDNLPSDYIYGFNFDDVECSTFANSLILPNTLRPEDFFGQGAQLTNYGIRLRQMMQLRYIQWKKDIYTSALPSQQFGLVSSVDISGVNIFNDVNITGSGPQNAVVNISSSVNPNQLRVSGQSVNTYEWSIPSAFDVLSLRKAEALQQWKQNTLRAGGITDDGFKAHFGVEPYYDSDENVHYLGSYSAALQVNSVEATAVASEGVNNKVGDLAATGTILVHGNKISFDAKDFGIIMCISSFLPESEYASNFLDKANKLYEQFDFYTPEFQNIGLEAIPINEVQYPEEPQYFNQVLGYAPRYYMYKSAVDRVFGKFADTYNMATQQPIDVQGTLESWVSPRREYVVGSNRNMATFYVDPRVYDNVFSLNASQYDQMLNNVYFDIKAIRPMSVLGLPQF